jgi:GntR family transcriptional regulator, transcriptional repressor for pyruvate dehydrogenase complex
MRFTPNLKIERLRGTLTDKVAEALVRLIRGGEYPPESRLPSEKEMAGRFGVSRTVVREAVSRLKSEGLVESYQGKGVFVRRTSADVPFRIDQGATDSVRSVLHIVELRKGIEAEAAALAASRRSEAELKEIQRALRELERQTHGGEGGVAADMAFHRAIARATGNPHLLALWDFIGQFLGDAIRLTRAYEARHAKLVKQVKREHATVAEAIARRDPEAARTAARRHLEMVAIRIASADRSFWASVEGALPVGPEPAPPARHARTGRRRP